MSASTGHQPDVVAGPSSSNSSQGGARTVLPPANNLAPARPWFSEPCLLGIGQRSRRAACWWLCM